MKTNKSFSKRLKRTKNGILKGRKPGINHFNSRQTRSQQLAAKVPATFAMKPKDVARYLPHS